MIDRKKKYNQAPISATVTGMSHDGRGIAAINGKTTFLFGGLTDEHVLFNYEQKHSRFDEGQVKQIIGNEHQDRTLPQCDYFNICGGCQLQHLNHHAQIKYKEGVLLELLNQQHINPKILLPPLVASPWGYRRKARVSVKYSYKKQQVMLGFRERKSHLITNLNHCQILHDSIGLKLGELNQLVTSLDSREVIPQLEIAITEDTKALIVRHLKPLSDQDLEKLQQFSEQHQVTFYLQAKGPDSIIPLNATETTQKLHYDLPDYSLKLFFNPLQFIQINAEINQKMIAQALDLLTPGSSDRVLDLFCGIGNLSLPFALQADTVVGVEGDASAVIQAAENANYNKLSNCQFYCDNLFIPSWQTNWSHTTFNKIILDPPRAGAAEICTRINQWQPEKLLYISCNPATFARDAAILKEKGFRLESLGIVDMFPQTKHIESMALFSVI